MADQIKIHVDFEEVAAAIRALDALTAAAERCAEALSKISPRPAPAIERTPVEYSLAGSRVGRLDPVGRVVR